MVFGFSNGEQLNGSHVGCTARILKSSTIQQNCNKIRSNSLWQKMKSRKKPASVYPGGLPVLG
jgi:hypothetical protein